MSSEQQPPPRFETLQLHAGYVLPPIETQYPLINDADFQSSSQEPDPTTKSRAVPIYATTVCFLLSSFILLDILMATN